MSEKCSSGCAWASMYGYGDIKVPECERAPERGLTPVVKDSPKPVGKNDILVKVPKWMQPRD